MNEIAPQSGSLLTRTKSLLRRFDLGARKGLGQHFLIDAGVLETIIRSADLAPSDLTLEIGPGLGVLTRELASRAGWVIAIELDDRLIEMLNQTLEEFPNVSIIHADALQIEPADIITREKANFPVSITHPQEYKLVANLPYYITSLLMRHFCEAALKPKIMVLMLQKEVARQIAAGPGAMSILSLSVQLYGQPEIVDYVPAANFYPPPKVDSAILKISMYPVPAAGITDEKGFFRLVRAGFCAARKQIANSLSQGLVMPKSEIQALLEEAHLSPQRRAESLALEEWAGLLKVFNQRKS